jgi:hypothetical protein
MLTSISSAFTAVTGFESPWGRQLALIGPMLALPVGVGWYQMFVVIAGMQLLALAFPNVPLLGIGLPLGFHASLAAAGRRHARRLQRCRLVRRAHTPGPVRSKRRHEDDLCIRFHR